MKPRALEGRHVLVVVAPERFCEAQLSEVRAVLEGRGAVVEVASTTPGPARGDEGAEVKLDVTIAAADPRRYGAVVLIGGEGAVPHLWEHGPLHALLRLAHGDGVPVGAASHAVPTLARGGLLRGVLATTIGEPRAKHELELGGARYVDEELVADGNIITSAHGHTGAAIAERVALAMLTAQSGGGGATRKEA